MAGKGGGAWKVAYADFVTAMMAFFMVMWITSQNQQIKESIAHHFSDPFGARDKNGKSGGVETSGAPFGIKENSRFSIRPKIKVDAQSGREYQSGMIIYYAGESTELDGNTTSALEGLLPELRWKAPRIDIVGYVDPTAKENRGLDHWALAHKRSLSIKTFFEGRGISPSKIKLAQEVVKAEQPSKNGGKKADPPEPGDRVEIRMPVTKLKATSARTKPDEE